MSDDSIHSVRMRAALIDLRQPVMLFFGGLIQALCFAPDPLPAWIISPLQIVLMAWLVRSIWLSGTAHAAALCAFFFALGQFSMGLYWLTISMHTYGHMPLPLAITALLAMSAYLAVFAAMAGWLTRKIGFAAWSDGHASSTGPLLAALIWAANWTLSEWLRGTLFTGFPWLNTGYAHVDSITSGWASVIGLHGVTFVSAFTAATLAGLVGATHFSPHHQPQRALAALIAIILISIGWTLSHIQWTQPYGPPLVARLIQGNVDQGLKFSSEQVASNIETHLKLAATPVPPGAPEPEVILLPETALALFQHQISPTVWQAWRQLAARNHSTVLMGTAIFDPATRSYTNSVIGLNADTSVESLLKAHTPHRYDKQHLVPFGEFIPWGFRWFVDLMAIPLGDFTQGRIDQPLFDIAGQRIAANICYEDIFGEDLLPALRGEHGASVLANFSNLGWFGNSFALRQHWQMARMRSMETARPTLRSTNTGTTGAIDEKGRALAVLPSYRPGVLDVSIQGQQGLTIFTRTGNAPILLLCLGILVIALYLHRIRHHKNDC